MDENDRMRKNARGSTGQQRSLYDLSITLDAGTRIPLYEQIYRHIKIGRAHV